nr:hypothetical protein [Tanacetum cinerariifolium]
MTQHQGLLPLMLMRAARIKLLEDKDKGTVELSGDDAPIKGRSLETGEEAGVERSTERGSNDTEELVNVLTSLDAANILTSGVQAVSVSPAAEVSNVGVPTGSGLVPTVSAIFTTTSVVTPYSRRKGKEKMMKSDTSKKKKLQEQIDVQMAREMKEKITREDQRMHKQIARDAKIARIHAEEELQMMIDGLDRNNDVIAKHLHEYEQSAADLTIGEKIELVNELVKYQDHHAKILKYQAQQSKPLSKKEQREFYMSVLKSHSGWKTKHFRGMTLKEIREKFIPIWKQIKRLCAHGFKRKRKSKEERAEVRAWECQKNEDIKGFQDKEMIEASSPDKAFDSRNLIEDKIKKEKEGLDSKLIGFESASKDLDTLLGSQRSNKNKEGLGYNVAPLPCSSLLSFQERYVLDKIA